MQPVYSIAGIPATEGVCGPSGGSVIGFDVPGYSRAWIIVAQNGKITFDGPMELPMPQYQLRCPQDIGYFQTAAYEITPGGQRGNVIGATQFTVRDASSVPQVLTTPYVPVPSGTPPPVGTPPYTPPPYTPPPIIETGGGGPPIQFVEPPPQESGIFGGMDLTTLGLIAIGAFVVLPPLLRRRR